MTTPNKSADEIAEALVEAWEAGTDIRMSVLNQIALEKTIAQALREYGNQRIEECEKLLRIEAYPIRNSKNAFHKGAVHVAEKCINKFRALKEE